MVLTYVKKKLLILSAFEMEAEQKLFLSSILICDQNKIGADVLVLANLVSGSFTYCFNRNTFPQTK